MVVKYSAGCLGKVNGNESFRVVLKTPNRKCFLNPMLGYNKRMTCLGGMLEILLVALRQESDDMTGQLITPWAGNDTVWQRLRSRGS